MNRALWQKCLSESALVFAALAIGVASFAWFRVHVVGEVDTTSFQRIINLLPKEWLKFTSVDVDWLISFVGRTAMTLDEPFLIMMIAIWGIVRGSDVVSGEISRGTMEMLLAQPVSRLRVFWIHTAVTIIGLLALTLLAWLMMWVAVITTNVKVAPDSGPGFWSSVNQLVPGPNETPDPVKKPMSEFVDANLFAPGIVNLFLLGCFISGMASLFSAFDRFRWRTLGIVVSVYMGAAMIKILAMTSETFAWAHWLTFFSLYEPELTIKLFQNSPETFWQMWNFNEQGTWTGFGPMGQNLALLLGAIGFFTIAGYIFHRRDIPQPL